MDSAEIRKRLNEISSNINKELDSFYSKLENALDKKKSKEKAKDKSRVVDRKPKASQIAENIPDLTAIEREQAMSVIKDVTQEIANNKPDYGYVDLAGRGQDAGSKEVGEGTGVVELIDIGRPSWLDELAKGIAKVFRRITKRQYFDVEGLVRGVTRKSKEKGLKRKNYMYMMLDVSGSMSSYSYKGTPLVSLFASYLPAMVSRYDGCFVEVDGDEVKMTEFKTLSRQGMSDKIEKNSIKLSGGGGAEFKKATLTIIEHIEKNNVTDPCIVLASDGHEDFNFMLLRNTFFMTTQYGVNTISWNGMGKQGFPNSDLGQKIILIDVD